MPWGEAIPGGVLARPDGLEWWRALPVEVRRVVSRAAHAPSVRWTREGRGIRIVGTVSLVSLQSCRTAVHTWTHRGRACWRWYPSPAEGSK
jgi:hypothetical protein